MCHNFVSLNNLKLICPFHNRPLCFACSTTKEGIITTLHSYFRKQLISPSLESRLHFRHFIYRKFKQNYVKDLAGTIIPYAKQRRKVLLECLQSHYSSEVSQATLTDIAQYDLASVYKTEATQYNKLYWNLRIFWGKNDETEDLDQNVRDFLASLMPG